MKCIILFFKKTLTKTTTDLVIDFLKGLLSTNIEYIINDTNIIIYFDNEEEIDFKAISYMMINDFNLELTLFETVVVKETKDLYTNEIIYNLKNKELLTNYINEKQYILNQTIKPSEILKKNILKEYYDDTEMLNIIKVYLENNLNTSLASTKLYLHRNTLINKIEKFISVTNYDVKKFKEAFVIYQLLI